MYNAAVESPTRREAITEVPRRVLVIGGGAAGLLAAGRAAQVAGEQGEPLEVILLEKTSAVGRKLARAGNRRGNLTNCAPVEEHVRHLGPQGSFARNALYRFGPQEVAAFFEELGLPLDVEPDGRVFPRSGRAADAVACLAAWCRREGVVVRTTAGVRRLVVHEGRVRGAFLIRGYVLEANAVILATGGWSYPQTGSSGDGWLLASEVGHKVHPPAAGLAGMETAQRPIGLAGVSLPDVTATALRDGRVLAETRGELLFTHVGLSGPAVLTLSLRVARALAEGPLTVRLDLFPSLSDADLDALLRHAQAEAGRAMAEALFTGLLPRRLAASLVARAGLPVDLRAARCTVAQRAMAVAAAKRAEFEVARARPLREAMVTVGGVDVGEVEPTTMASRVAPGLYLAGELLDVAGETGGYNLQFAFSSGRLAGESAARAVLREPPSPPLWRHSTP